MKKRSPTSMNTSLDVLEETTLRDKKSKVKIIFRYSLWKVLFIRIIHKDILEFLHNLRNNLNLRNKLRILGCTIHKNF